MRKLAFAAFLALVCAAHANELGHHFYSVTFKKDGAIVGSWPVALDSPGATMNGPVEDIGYAECVPGGMKTAFATVGWVVIANRTSGDKITFEVRASELTISKNDLLKQCFNGAPPMRVAHWEPVTLELKKGEAYTWPTSEGYSAVVERTD
ncbi:hypothetical protein [Frateuria defendens]|uniref:hypothetical protein n=1 Tax=Frateuria defendens TaxID=2219559 RepID=UPI001294101E|nr:hypothetical protein [Frateuria defendens]